MHKTMGIPILPYSSEIWVIKIKDEQKIKRAEMKFLRAVKGYSLRDRLQNDDTRKT